MNPPTQHPTVGDLQITLARAGRMATFTGAELAVLVGSPGIVLRLAAALYSRGTTIAEGKGVTVLGEAIRQEETNERNGMDINSESRSFRDRGSKGKGNFQPEVERMACYLTDRLDDPKSLAFYRRVVASLPAEIVRDALTRALDLQPAKVRRSRAAYFTSLVQPHLQRRLPDS